MKQAKYIFKIKNDTVYCFSLQAHTSNTLYYTMCNSNSKVELCNKNS